MTVRRAGFQERRGGVSPVIATILMVAITVVLAGVLVAYLRNIAPANTDGSLQMGSTSQKTQGNYTFSLVSGKYYASEVDYTVMRPNGTLFVAGKLSNVSGAALGGSNNISFSDNNNNSYLDTGDTIRVWGVDGGGTVEDDWKLELHRGSRTVLNLRMVG